MEAQDNINYTIPSFIPLECFRTYDIRGLVGEHCLTINLAYAIGLSIGSEARELNQNAIIVGRDGRLSADNLTKALMQGLCETGLEVIDIGKVPTPTLYYATHCLSTRSGVMVTASHNPKDHNGFKIVLAGNTLRTQGIQAILQRIQNQNFIYGKGHFSQANIIGKYIACIIDKITLTKPLKVVVDCGNGIAGLIVPELYRKLGCEVIELFCEVDGNFPNHHPDPTIPENLLALIHKVKEVQADIGLAFDGDADRIGVVTNKGEVIWPDRQMMLYSQDVLKRHPGAEIIFDVKCSRHLPEIIRQAGGKPLMWQTGHSVLKAKLFERNAPLAGEMSGHIFFRDNWFGFDDGLYVGARLLQILSQQSLSSSEVFAALPNSMNTPELKLPMVEANKANFMQRLAEAHFGNAKIIKIDGLRVEFPNGWGLIRPSNTSSYLILRFEANDEVTLREIQNIFREQLLKIDQTLLLPF